MVAEVKIVFSVNGKQYEETTIPSNRDKLAEFLARIMEDLALNNSSQSWREFADQLADYAIGGFPV
jgi:hypothetical protein